MSRPTDESGVALRIASELRVLGIEPGSLLLVHASLRSLGPLPGGAETIVRGLEAAIAPDGTLLMPALTWEQVPSDRHSTLETPSHVGALAEYFRTRPGTLRSIHPTHSVCAAGPAAAALLTNHRHDDTPCGPHSPFRLLLELDARILMLGCGLRPNTTMHAIEELVDPPPPYLFGPTKRYTLIDDRGIVTEKAYRTHGFQGWDQRYDRVARLPSRAFLRWGRVLQAEAAALDTRGLRTAALHALSQDPLYFVAPTRESA